MKNGKIRNIKKELLSDNWYVLNKFTYDYQKEDGTWEEQQREAYDRGNGAARMFVIYDEDTIIIKTFSKLKL